jgi:hypothetical protein
MGQKPNEHIKETSETLPEMEVETKLHQVGKPTVSKTHSWKQKGTTIVCDSCETPHGFRVHPGQQLVGIDEKGMPKLVRIWI